MVTPFSCYSDGGLHHVLVRTAGTGAGQWRRIVVPGVNVTASPTNRTWVLDAPFAVTPLSHDSIIEIMPFRGASSAEASCSLFE
jgi:hypothetical protein